MPLNLFIIGPSGSGKSTQAKKIAQKYKLKHISTGQVFRHHLKTKTSLGLKAKKYIDQGVWVPSTITLNVLTPRLRLINNQNFIIDGFPRLPDQPALIKQYLADNNRQITALIQLSVTAQEINDRRQKQKSQGKNFQDSSRSDNIPTAIASRQQQYIKNTGPILKFFKNEGKLIDIDGNRPVEPVFNDICQQIDKLLIKQ